MKHTPPPPFIDLRVLKEIFAAVLPPTADHLYTMMGRRSKPPSKRQGERLAQGIEKLIKRSAPYLVGIAGMTGQLPREHAYYILFEGLVREQLRAAGVRLKANQDALAKMVQIAQRQTTPKAHNMKLPCYRETRQTIELFLQDMCRTNLQSIDQVCAEWSRSADIHSHVQYVRQLPAAVRRFRFRPPTRATDKLVVQLSDEYRNAAGYFEQRLRLLVAIAAANRGEPRSWENWKRTNLERLIKIAENTAELAPLAKIIDRPVRNALSHGTASLNVNTGTVTFHERHQTITWRTAEFFDRARCLTIATVALAELELLCIRFTWECLAESLWAMTSGNDTGFSQ